MASPIAMIKEAFVNKDWDLVAEAYEGLTGEQLSDNKIVKKKGRPPSKKVIKVEEESNVNLFVDDLTLATNFLPIDKKLAKKRKKVERQRKPYPGKVKINCTKCNKEYEVEAYAVNNLDSEASNYCPQCFGQRGKKKND